MEHNLKQVYDKIYYSNPSYNFHYPPKDLLVDLYVASIDGKILDVGCGEGHHLQRMIECGIDAFGVEISSVCCQKYLQNIPHANTDICDYSKKSESRFDGIICFDVLEHIPEDQLNTTLKALISLAPSALLGLANHSDIQCENELHLIQENCDWWCQRLSVHYQSVYPVISFFDKKFFCIEVSNNQSINQINNRWTIKNRMALNLANAFDEYRNQSETGSLALQSEYTSLQSEYTSLQSRHNAVINSKMVKLCNLIRKMIGKTLWD